MSAPWSRISAWHSALTCKRVLRPDLRLLAMSATADGGRLSRLMAAEVIDSAGLMFPVKVEHQPRDIANIRDLSDAVARAIRAALSERQGDILAFLPGMPKSAAPNPPSTVAAPRSCRCTASLPQRTRTGRFAPVIPAASSSPLQSPRPR